MNLKDIISVFKPRKPEEHLASLESDAKETYKKVMELDSEKGRYLSLFLNEPQNSAWIVHVKSFLWEYCHYTDFSNRKFLGDEYRGTRIYAPFSDWIYDQNGKDGRGKFYLGDNVIEENEVGNDVDYIGLLQNIIRTLSRNQELRRSLAKSNNTYYTSNDMKEDKMLKYALQLKNEFYQRINSVLPDLDKFYGLTEGSNRDAHLANEVRKDKPCIPAMAQYFKEFLNLQSKEDGILGQELAMELVWHNFALNTGVHSVKDNVDYGGTDLKVSVADFLFSSPDTTKERLKALAESLSFSSNIWRILDDKGVEREVLNISQYSNLLGASRDASALGYVRAYEAIKMIVPSLCRKLRVKPGEIGLEMKNLPNLTTPRENTEISGIVVPGINDDTTLELPPKDTIPELPPNKEEELEEK